MSTTLIEISQIVIHPGQSITLQNVSWPQFEDILAELGSHRSSKIAYYKEILEIMVPSPEHEYFKTSFGGLIEDLATELGLDYENFGSTTWKNQEVSAGAEPDECFYIQSFPVIQGRFNIDLKQGDPPPDLVLEIDLTSKSLDSLPIYARLGVPEVWRYDKGEIHVYHLTNDKYIEYEFSLALPDFPVKLLPDFVKQNLPRGRRLMRQDFSYWVRNML